MAGDLVCQPPVAMPRGAPTVDGESVAGGGPAHAQPGSPTRPSHARLLLAN